MTVCRWKERERPSLLKAVADTTVKLSIDDASAKVAMVQKFNHYDKVEAGNPYSTLLTLPLLKWKAQCNWPPCTN